ncbi:histidine kinase [Patescibacteria group bacterium]|nr:histidine kinase [Patescibacteria group bacterium]
MSPNIFFWNQILDITGRSAIILIIAFVISHLVIKNNFNIVKPGLVEKISLVLTFILIYTLTLFFNYGEERLLIFDLALPIIIVSGILAGLQVSFTVSLVASLMLKTLFPLSWPYAILTLVAGIVSGLISWIRQSHRKKMVTAALLQFGFSIMQVGIFYFLVEGYLYQTLWANIISVLIAILTQVTSVVIFLYIIYSIIHFQKQQQTISHHHQARLKTLESQINPHFLFNSLNTIGSLTRTNPAKAHDLVIELSALLRSSLRKQGNLVPLVDEIKNIDSYFTIAKARFGTRVKITKDIPDIYNKYQVPNLIWEPIVENAIIHNISTQDEVKVHICAKKDRNLLYLITQDNGQGIPEQTMKQIKKAKKRHKHLGLPSTYSRLKNFYERDDLVDINTSQKGTIVTLKIPI